jgi:phosphoserine phosphatase
MTIGRKAVILQELVNEHGFSLEGSVAIGDSDGDIELLSAVEKPIAFNPSEGLFEHAKTAGWPIVIERKNIAYHLERKDDALVLAKTIIY